MDPTHFLGIPLVKTEEHRYKSWTGGTPEVEIRLQLEHNVYWVLENYTTQNWWTAFLRIGPCTPVEASADNLAAIEESFGKWIADFQSAASVVNQLWPEGKTGQ